MKSLLATLAAIALAFAFATSAQAQSDPGQEIATAHAHALMAKAAGSVDMAHTHLHHVINCLVGPGGDGFQASAGNPCKGQGDGAIPAAEGNAALLAQLDKALAKARAGLQTDQLASIHSDAAKAATTLKAIPTEKSGAGDSW